MSVLRSKKYTLRLSFTFTNDTEMVTLICYFITPRLVLCNLPGLSLKMLFTFWLNGFFLNIDRLDLEELPIIFCLPEYSQDFCNRLNFFSHPFVLELLRICQLPDIFQLKEDISLYKMYFIRSVYYVWKIIHLPLYLFH